MITELFAYIVGGLATVAAAAWTTRGSRKVAEATENARRVIAAHQLDVDKVRVDGEAYARAQRITNTLVTQLTKEVTRLNIEIADLRSQLGRERTHSAELAGKVRSLQITVGRLTALLAEHGIPLPQHDEGRPTR